MTEQDRALADAPRYRSRWLEVQSRFVDEPHRSVEEANGLVAEVIQKLTAVFGGQQKALKGQVGGSGERSAEGLRVALRRYGPSSTGCCRSDHESGRSTRRRDCPLPT